MVQTTQNVLTMVLSEEFTKTISIRGDKVLTLKLEGGG